MSKFDVSSFSHDLRYIDFQTGHFPYFEQFKVCSHSDDLGQVKINPTRFL